MDPSSPEYQVLSRTEDYDTSVNLLVEVDHLTKGQFVVSETEPSSSQGPSQRQSTYNLSQEEQKKVEDGKKDPSTNIRERTLNSLAIDQRLSYAAS